MLCPYYVPYYERKTYKNLCELCVSAVNKQAAKGVARYPPRLRVQAGMVVTHRVS